MRQIDSRSWVNKPEGGYRLIPLSRLYAAWWCYRQGELQFRDLRAYFALEEMTARRCVMKPGRTACYTLDELENLTDAGSAKGIRSSLRRVERAGLATWNSAGIGFHEEAFTPARGDFAGRLAQITNHRRRVPVPRRTLRRLAKATRPVFIAAVLGHLFRCVYAKGRLIAAEGSISARWIAEVFEVDHRNVKRVKAELRASNWLICQPSHHWHRQRYGQRVLVNLAWREGNAPARASQHAGADLPPRLAYEGAGLPPPDHTENFQRK